MTENGRGSKPAKPYPGFPLTPHNSGKWAKKIRGKLRYFGRWEDPDGALREYNAQKEALHAGREPVVVSPETMTVRDLFNDFLNRQLARVDEGVLEPRSYTDQKGALQKFATVVGPGRFVGDLHPSDFAAARDALGKGVGPHVLTRAVRNVKAAFNYGVRNGKVREPVYGSSFDVVAAKIKRRAEREAGYRRGAKMFSPRECRDIVKHAETPLLAMVLLGLNAGFYAIDIATLPLAALDLDGAWLEYPRTKTEIARKVPLWPETVKAIRAALAERPEPRNPADAGLVFVTKYGNRWVHNKVHRGDEGISKVTRTDAVNGSFARLLKDLKIHRPGVNFSALRHTFRTAADETGDRNATLMLMGHSFHGMDEFYVRDVARKRLEKVTDHVRQKLLNPKKVGPRTRAKPGNAGR